MKKIYLILAIFCISTCFAQTDKRSNIWYFGQSAGLDFSAGNPVSLTNGHIVGNGRGNATVCDENGNLVLYSDGEAVWNRNHNIIQGADNLDGSSLLTTQNGVIIPHPKFPNQYYVLSIPQGDGSPTANINFSLLDMSLNGGEGGVISKNNLLASNMARTAVVIRHCNNHDFWLLTHEVKTNNFRAYLIDDNGLNTKPIITDIGSVNDGVSSVGDKSYFIRASTDGKQLAIGKSNVGNNSSNFAEIFDFDGKTGKILKQTYSQDWHKFRSGTVPNDMCFSPNGKFLYVSRIYVFSNDVPNNTIVYMSELFQLDLSKPSTDDASITLITTRKYTRASPLFPEGAYLKSISGLQIGLDGKIYVSLNLKTSLSVINNPDSPNATFALDVIDLANRNANWTLPSLLPPKKPDAKVVIYLKPNPKNCNDVFASQIKGFDETKNIQYQWYFNGNAIKNATDSTLILTKAGKYYLLVQEKDGCQIAKSDETDFVIKNLILPPVIAAVSQICVGEKVPTISATGTTIKWFEDKVLAKPLVQSTTYLPKIDNQTPSKATFYATQTTPTGCVSPPDSVEIVVNSKPKIDISSRKMLYCFKSSIQNPEILVTTNETLTYEWTFDKNIISKEQNLKVSNYGNYVVKATNQNNCVVKDSVLVEEACFQLFVPTAFSPNEDGINDKLMLSGNGVTSFDLYIYNRWGDVVFSKQNQSFTSNFIETWDGKINDKTAPNGIYAYKINVRIVKDDKEITAEQVGSLVIFR